MRYYFPFIILFFIPALALGQSSTAQPYTVVYSNNNIHIEAKPYAPYDMSPMAGITTVYNGQQPLYSIDSYYTEPTFVSNSGTYMTVVRISEIVNGQQIEYDKTTPVIEIFKNGKQIKSFLFSSVFQVRRIKL